MGKIITAVLGIGVVVGGAYYALNHMGGASTRESSAQKRQLDNVRQAASRIESDAEKRAQELDAKMQVGQ
jgi:hypothetical protein